ncbi:NAD-dependent mannitol dehydrogenase domain protein [Pseudomonas fluorescens]|uniref:NAD-dependent mannitol dehydrogenase domain protein n=1 Tax=Pseudomonas fluorescens TaxID=294 RepID=A0A0P8ZGM1_PSEFL|nr:NAD-dependent mannitol dehydrogenase domain protein [Pseudomonas fluorescens]
MKTDSDAMTKAQSSFDRIIDTIPVKHSVDPYVSLLTG